MSAYSKKQIAGLVNEVVEESTGVKGIVKEDLSNVVDQGTSVLGTPTCPIVAKNMVCRIGRDVYRIQKYAGRAPSVYMDSWEYGAIKLKISFGLYEAQENASWKLSDGVSIDPFVFKEPNATTKYFDKSTTFEVQTSITEEMMKNAFTSAEAMSAFIEGIFVYIKNTIQKATDELIMRTINNFTATTIKNLETAKGTTYDKTTGVRARNMIFEYNQKHSDAPVTKEKAHFNQDYLRFVELEKRKTADRLQCFDTQFNIDGQIRQTELSDLKVVSLSDYVRAAEAYLATGLNQFKDVEIMRGDIVTKWQASGDAFTHDDEIKLITSAGDDVDYSGIICVMFDKNALGVSCQNDRTTTQWNGRGEYTNYFFKRDANYFNDTSENFVVFYEADVA